MYTLKCKGHSRFIIAFIAIWVVLSVAGPVAAQEKNSIETLRQTGEVFARIAEKVSPAVVGIRAERTVTSRGRQQMPDWFFEDPFGGDFFEFFKRDLPNRRAPQQRRRQIAKGSGFIISADGYILTNNHLVGDTEKVTVKLLDGLEKQAEVVGTDEGSDIAVIKIDGEDLPHLELADSDAIKVGEWVLAIGNPFGLSHTVTAGIVSAKGRNNLGIADYEDFIQTDAAINFGNSGGPLLNLDGEVVGINTAIIGATGNIGIGLAIPANMAKTVYEQLVDTGKVVRGYLGVGIQDLNAELAESFGLETTDGVLIPSVLHDSPAAKAGIKAGDVIVEFNGEKVADAHKLQRKVATLLPGTKVEIVILRDGKTEKLTAVLAERKKGLAQTEDFSTQDKLGVKVRNLTDDLARRYGYEDQSGVIVEKVVQGSLAASAGIKPGNLIMKVNRKDVANVNEFNEAVAEATDTGKILLLVKEGSWSRYIILTLPKE